MFGSQALETAIGLVLMFFIVSLGSSAIVETIARLMSKRAKDLEQVIGSILAGSGAADTDVQAAIDLFKGTTIYDGLQIGSGTSIFGRWKRPSYISAKSFADAVAEIERTVELAGANLPAGLAGRLDSIRADITDDVLRQKAEVEGWFDSVMARMEGAYKRWVTAVLFGAGLALTVVANASTYDTAVALWNDPATRAAVVEAAGRTTAEGAGSAPTIESVGDTVDSLDALSLPIGWDDQSREAWAGSNWVPTNWTVEQGQFATLMGWLTTSILVLLGAPFWFDLLTKLVSLRSNGSKPTSASHDGGSATSQLLQVGPGPAGGASGTPASG